MTDHICQDCEFCTHCLLIREVGRLRKEVSVLEDAVNRKSAGDVSVAYERAAEAVAGYEQLGGPCLSEIIRALAKEPNGE